MLIYIQFPQCAQKNNTKLNACVVSCFTTCGDNGREIFGFDVSVVLNRGLRIALARMLCAFAFNARLKLVDNIVLFIRTHWVIFVFKKPRARSTFFPLASKLKNGVG